MALVATIEKNARERVQIELTDYKGHDLIGVRVYADKGGDEWVATPKGLSLRVGMLPELVKALATAEQTARSAGLL